MGKVDRAKYDETDFNETSMHFSGKPKKHGVWIQIIVFIVPILIL